MQQNGDEFNLSESIKGIWDKMADWLNAIIVNLPNFLLAIIVFIIFIIIARYVARLLNKLLIRQHSMQDTVRGLTVRLLKFIVIGIGFFFALNLLHLDKVLTTAIGALGVLSLAIGFAVKGTLNNTFSGIILSFIPEIKTHDWIEVNEYAGEVLEVNLRNTLIRESDNNHVIIPNSKIVEGTFKNFSRTKRSRVIVDCRVDYNSDLEMVENLTTKTIENIFKPESGEVVEFAYIEFAESSIDFVVRFWTDVTKQRDILFAKHKAIRAIKKVFDQNDIVIPRPIRTLHFDQNNQDTKELLDEAINPSGTKNKDSTT